MPTTYPMAVLPDAELSDVETGLRDRGISLVVGSLIGAAGMGHAKAVPLGRLASFHRTGIGASPSWNVFCVDNDIALTPELGVVGDMRLRADLSALSFIDESVAWVPVELFDQLGEPVEVCARGQLRRLQAASEAQSITTLVGTEVEFTVVDDTVRAADWQAYGVQGFFGRRHFLVDLERALSEAGICPEQLHAEYGVGQYEVSFCPAEPLQAADAAVLARLVISETARRCGLRVSFSPLPNADSAGNGAHLHMSFQQDGKPLLSGGSGPHGLTEDGAAALAGIVSGLPQTLAVFAGSVLSSHRLQPGRWSGAHACWGLENREAAVRLCAATPANPHGANIELKCVDPSANPYLAVATMLGLAMNGIETLATLPAEVTDDPAHLEPGVVPQLGGSYAGTLDSFAHSKLARSILGEAIVGATLAVRSHELKTLGEVGLPELCDRLRFSWTF